MKKYLSGLIAIVIAVGASVFANANHFTPKQKTTSYYWYLVNSSGKIVAGSQAFMGNAETSAYAETNLPCTPGTNSECIRGFDNPITVFPSSATGDTSPLLKQ